MNTQTITIGFLLFAIIMFAWEKIPLWVTAMIVAVGLVVTKVLEPKDAFAGFTDSNVLLFMAMFIIGAAFLKREWHSALVVLLQNLPRQRDNL